jgi:hypothetical protein
MHLLSDSRFAHHLWIRLAIPSLAAWLWCFCATVPTDGQPPATAEETTPGNDSGLLSSSPKKKGAEDSETGTTLGNQEGRSPLRFRRWFAPIEKIEDWPWGDSRYRPVLREQFETWIASTPSQAWSHLPSEVVVESIQLDATYKEQQFLEGKGRMRIELRSDQPAILFLEPLSMAIDRLRWSNGEEADAGMFRRGDFGVLCPSNGTLLFDWTLNRQEFGDENVSRFSLQMPPSPLIHLNLTLPATIEPTLSEGLILQPENTQKGKRWPISLGGHHQTVLRLKKNPSRASTPLPAIGMRQSITYDLSVQGVEVKSRFHFDKLQPSLFDEVLIELDRALHPISVEYGQTSLQWSIVPSSSDEETVRMLVSIPETESTSVKELQVTAFCALTTDQLWSLPRIRLANENVFWQQTKATLVLSSPLVLRSLKPVLAGQVPSNVIPGGHKNQTYELFYHVPDGRVEVEVGNFLPDLTCATGNDVQLRSNEIASRLVADFSVAEGKRHLIEGVIHAEWTIDSIESVPPGNLAEIYWEPRQNEDGKSHKLSILMKEPVTPENPCRLLVSARRLYPDDYKKLQLTDFSPLHFPEVLSGDHLYSLEATPPLRLETSENGNEPPLEKLSPNDPVVQQRFLESTSLHGLILQDTIANVRKHFHLKIDRPSYSSEIVSRVVARNETLFQSFSFRCLPEATQVDRVFVHFHAPSADGEAPSWKWTLGPEQKPLTEIRRLSRADQARMEIPPGGETWEILLTPSRSGPFELHARSNRPLTPPLGIVLASMPGAVSQQGRVTLEIPESLAIRPHGQILTPIPPEPIEPDRFRKTRAAFQYDPLRSPAEDIAMPLEIHSNRIDLPTQRAWIWHLDLHSHFESKGRVVHLAMISLENRGEEFLNITLPEKIPLENVQQVRIDGRRTGWHLAKDKGETNVEFRLPDHRRFLFIEIEFTQQRSPLKSFHRLTPSFPAFDLPVLNRHWSTWFPKDFRTTSVRSTRSRNDSAAIERSLAEFFFPGMTSRRFHPLKRSSWNELLPFDLQHDRARQIADILASSVGDSEFLNKIASTSKQETTGETAEDPSSQENVSEQVTWGELFVSDAFTEKVLLHPFDESGTSFQLLIDHAALKRIGVFPDTPIPFVRGKSEKIQGLRVLDRAHLSVCIHENTLMITSMNRTAMYSDELLPIMGDHIVKVRDGLLAGEMSETVKDHSQRTYLRATRWAQLEHLERSPWHKQDMMAGFSLETPHWRLLRIDMPETDFEMVIANQKTLYTYWWLAFVGIIILTWRRPLGNPWFLFLVVFASGLCLFFVPLTWKLLLSGICMGACTSLAFWLIRPAPTKSPGPPGRILHRIPIPSASMKQLSPKTFPLVLLHWLIGITFFLLLVLFTVKGAFAQETTSEENPAVSSKEHTLPPYRVFFPVDRNQNPAGPYVYLPESFYHSLTRQVDFAGAGGYHWKIQKARYEGTLSRLPNSETISLESLVATFHLDVSEAQTTIRLPLMPLLPDGATGMAGGRGNLGLRHPRAGRTCA